MCYSVESSAKTTLLSLTSIIILLRSNVPHFQWMAMTIAGFSIMQLVELLLWLTNPRKGCTLINKIITLALIPLVVLLQPVGGILGSFFVKPWAKCSQNRKVFIGLYIVVTIIILYSYFYSDFSKDCTTVTANGHLNWWPSRNGVSHAFYYLWAVIILTPLLLLWDVSYKALIILLIGPFYGYHYGLTTDSNASIWCYYASFTSIAALIMYGLYNFNVYNILQ